MSDRRLYILLAEDEPQLIYLIRRYADRSGYQLVDTQQNSNLLILAQQLQPAVVILDIGMPEMDVDLVLSHLRSNSATCHIPIVLCSSSEPALQGWEASVDDCWLTPVLYDDFENTLVALGTPVAASTSRKEVNFHYRTNPHNNASSIHRFSSRHKLQDVRSNVMPEESLVQAFDALHEHLGARWVGTEAQGRAEMVKVLRGELGYDKQQANTTIDAMVNTGLLRYHLLNEETDTGANPAITLGLGYWQIGRE